MSEDKRLKAGAGKSYIEFPDEAFPTAREHYTGIHDLPHARVVVLDQKERYVILNLEIVNVFPDTRERLMNILYEETGVKPANIWYHNCHVLSTPHAWKIDFSGGPNGGSGSVPGGPGGAPSGTKPDMPKRTQQEQRSVELVSDAICIATRNAAKQAVNSIRAAKVGSGTGYSLANANRNIEFTDGWWVSCNDEGTLDHNVPILRIDDEKNEPIAILFGFHAQPAVLDMLFLGDGGRLVSGDIAGYSTEFIEQEYPGSVAMYFTGAGGDGTPYFRGEYSLRGRGGRKIDKNIREKAYLLTEMLGERIGQQVIMAMERIHTEETNSNVTIAEIKIDLPKRKREERVPGRPQGPVREFKFEEDGTIAMPLSALQIGDMGFIGLIPEIDQKTALDIEENSPYKTTLVSTFTNSGPKESGIGKYMGQSDCYERITFQAVNSMFAKGAAEKMVKEAVKLLMNVKNEVIDFSSKHDIMIRNFDGSYQPMDQPFFEAEEIAPKTWKVLSDGDYSYVIEGDEKAIVIDSGYGAGNIREFCQSLVKVPITSIINTHHHFDHTANNAYFDEVYMDALAKEQASVPYPSFQGIYFPKTYKVIPVEDGFTIELGNRILEIIQTPDHTEDGICILDRKQGILYTGDEFMKSKNLSGTVEHWKECLEKLMNHRDEFHIVCGGEGIMPIEVVDKQYQIVVKILEGTLVGEMMSGGPGGGRPGGPEKQRDSSDSGRPADGNKGNFDPRNPEEFEGHKVYYRKFPHPEDVQHEPKNVEGKMMKLEYQGYRFMYESEKVFNK